MRTNVVPSGDSSILAVASGTGASRGNASFFQLIKLAVGRGFAVRDPNLFDRGIGSDCERCRFPLREVPKQEQSVLL